MVEEVVTNVDSDAADTKVATEFFLAGREQLPSFCVGDLSSSAVRPDVDVASFGNDSVAGPSTVPPTSHDVLVPPDDLCDVMHFISSSLSSSSLPTMTAQIRESFCHE